MRRLVISGSGAQSTADLYHTVSGRWRILSAYLPHSQYPVTSKNNTLSGEHQEEGFFDVSVPEGDYTAAELAAAYQVALNDWSTGPVFTVSVSTLTGKITFAVDSTEFYLLASSTAATILGLGPEDTASAASTTLPNLPQLTGPMYFTIHFGDTDGQNHEGATGLQSALVIPVDVAHGSVLNYTDTIGLEQSFKFRQPTRRLETTIRDDQGDIARLNGGRFTFVLEQCSE